MMSPLALALALALVLTPSTASAEPDAAGTPGASAAASGARAPLDEKITINLKEADLGQVLERLATLLGKTLILQPGIDGKVTVDVRDTSVSDVLVSLQTSHALSIRLEGDRMYVARAGETIRRGPGKPDEDGLGLAYLADPSLPRRLGSEKPRRFDGSFEFRDEGTGSSAFWEIGGSLGTVTLPGCAGPLPILLLPGDSFDGIPRVVFGPGRGGAGLPAAGRSMARIVAPGGTVRPPDCSGALTLKAVDSKDGIPKAVPISLAGQYQLTVKILEAGAGDDEILAAPRIQIAAGEVGTIQSGSQKPAASGALLGRGLSMNVAVLVAGETDALVACSISATRDIEPARGEPPVTIRIARTDESLRLTYGKPERVTVSPTYGRGTSALVLELTLERLPEKRRER